MLYVHSVTLIVRWLAFAVVSVDLALVAYILYRRAARNRYYEQKDAAQTRFASTVAAFLAGDLPLRDAISRLQARRYAEVEAIKALLLGGITAATRPRATELLFALGYVEKWVELAFGRRRGRELLQFIAEGRYHPPQSRSQGRRWQALRRVRLFSVGRAVAVGQLGQLAPEFAGIFLREALHDPSPYVGRLSVAAIGRNHIPEAVPLLLEELRKAVAGETELPVRSIKTALVRYGIGELRQYLAAIDHPSPRFRFLVVDTIREICTKAERSQSVPSVQKEFPAPLRLWFLEKAVGDDSADVRARSAAVISYFRDAQAQAALRRLLQDDSEFVRLHAVRGCAHRCYSELIGDVMRRVTDQRWRVREAAVRTLAHLDPGVTLKLGQFFLDTSDRYASEQIAEELQRSGLGRQIVTALGSADGEKREALEVCAKMVRLGMDSLLAEMLATDTPFPVRSQLIEVLGPSRRPQFISVLQRLAASETDPLKEKAEVLLRSHQAAAGTAAAGAAV